MSKRIKILCIVGAIALFISGTINVVAVTYLYAAKDVSYNNGASQLESDNVQDAIDELNEKAEDYDKLRNMIYPVGGIYLSMTDDTVDKVEAKFGGTWEKIEGRFLLGESSDYAINTTGGSADAVVVSHNHTFTGSSSTTSSAGGHTHTLQIAGQTAKYAALFQAGTNRGGFNYGNVTVNSASGLTTAGAHTHTVTAAGTISTNGVSGTGKNMPPYLVVYMYKRTA